ncbi:MAG: pilus assembly protein N-terminal domain-containing protein [Steroidobacteraceae bacterium]
MNRAVRPGMTLGCAFVALLAYMPIQMAWADNALPTKLDLYVGDSRLLQARVQRLAIGNGKLISISTLDSGELLLLGEAAGTTTVQLWLKGGVRHKLTVQVTELDLEGRLEQIRTLLLGTRNITARVAGNRIALEGLQVSDSDRERAVAIAASFPGVVLNFIGKQGWETMIQMDVRIVELRNTSARDLGIRWDSAINGPSAGLIADLKTNPYFRVRPADDAVPGGIGTVALPGRVSPAAAYLGWTTAIESRIDLLEQQGMAEIVAEPTLSCRSGGEARFVSGGEIPIPVVDGRGSTNVEYKEYGIILNVRPRADGSGAIYAEVEAEISQIDDSIRVQSYPGFLKRKSTASVNMHAGETIVIAGLTARSSSNERQYVPGLGKVPAVGGLFGSRKRRQQHSELIVLITPRTVQAGVPGPEDASAEQADKVSAGRERLNSTPTAPGVSR